MFNYQCSLMHHGLLYMNFTDAIAEGDGDHIMHSKKHLAGSTNISDNSHDHPCMVCIWERCASGLTVTSTSYRLDVKHDELRHHGINHNFISYNRDLWFYAYHPNE